ncbi:MAG TPA: isoleucine--tRNA ligase [Candidatus Thermoplasmatota archaeon]|nr:isoleucine--tRNA ligase [Candidatus Thermoplasmatota archaeon]
MVKEAEREFRPVELEARVSAHWKAVKAYEKTRRHRARGKRWYFIDGPPYATGHIHLGTARNKFLKDLQVRFMSMRGFAVRDQPGFDMHGLPIEVKVEKELGIANKKDIEAYGVERFVEACRAWATKNKDVMTEEFKELAVWMDWDRPYMTITNGYIEGAWWALAEASKRGLLFESERVLTWCWRCESALANAEIEYADREDPSVFVKFPLRGRADESLVVWTTTPWTLPANVAVAAHPDLSYAKARVTRPDGKVEFLHVVSSQAETVARLGRYTAMEIVATHPGKDLEGLYYDHPFASEVPRHAEATGWNNRVILAPHVTGDRTGLVHTATGHGVEDFEAGKKYGIGVFSPVGPDGRYTAEAGVFAGLAVKDRAAGARDSEADTAVIERLRARGLLLHLAHEKHAYGECWRCHNPQIFRATRQWFIDVRKIQPKMIREVERVDWTPEWAGSARQMDWVKNARDWCISRQRYWGIPLPVWKCDTCHEVRVVGSSKELAKAAKGYKRNMDFHRPWIDKVTIPCKACRGTMKRVEDVLDVWFDSAVAAWAELDFPGSKTEFEKWFPCDWICEGLDQTRGWFYSQLGAGVASMGKVPYRQVVMHGWVNDEQGRPMSKSLGNIIQPKTLAERYGADALRFSLLSSGAPWDDLSFGMESAKNVSRSFNILWNVHVFATRYMALDRFDPAKAAKSKPKLRLEDRWILSRLQGVVATATEAIGKAEVHRAAREIERFAVDDLSRWYVRLVRDRAWAEAEDPDKLAAYLTLHETLLTVAKLLAPFAPHLAEAIYQDFDGRHATVHMEDWPVPDRRRIDRALDMDMARVRSLVEASSNARQKANMKLRWPVAKITVSGDAATGRAVKRLEPLLLDQANAKAVEFVGQDWEGLVLTAEPARTVLGPLYKADAPAVMDAIRAMKPRDLASALEKGPMEVAAGGRAFTIPKDAVKFSTTLPDHVLGASFEGGNVYLDTHVTDEIKGEGYARELVRRVQEMRKELALAVDARIDVEADVRDAEFRRLVEGRLADVAGEVRAERFALSEAPTGASVRTWDVEGVQVEIAVTPREAPKPARARKAKRPAAKPRAKATKAKAPARKAKKARRR